MVASNFLCGDCIWLSVCQVYVMLVWSSYSSTPTRHYVLVRTRLDTARAIKVEEKNEEKEEEEEEEEEEEDI